jgi:5-methylcytosine-specific restriction endonuclease McrA
MHLARIRRHGYPELKKNAYRCLEKLPHPIIDDFIRKNCKKMIDEEIAKYLRKKGFKNATIWNVKYRRRKLGIKKYLYGEIKKHKAWIRAQAIKKYGNICELCGYNLHVETHHIIPKHKGGHHEINNLIVLCSNCHALITNKKLNLKSRKEIKKFSKRIKELLKSAYPYLG